MGSTSKTLMRLMTLTATGDLAPESAICDIGATQLFGDTFETAAAFLDYYAERSPKARNSSSVPEPELRAIAEGGFLGDLLTLAGFRYTALDIFHATNTVLFDLNVHEPGPGLKGKFDLVLNLGTTEHVINQLRAFQTIHDLVRVGGLIYHDLPLAGYLNHALFRYDPLFFQTILPANDYQTLLQEVTIGSPMKVPSDLQAMGFRMEQVTDIGIEVIVRRTNPSDFRVPLEASTSLSIDPNFSQVGEDDLVMVPAGVSVNYGVASDLHHMSMAQLTKAWVGNFVRGLRRRTGVDS